MIRQVGNCIKSSFVSTYGYYVLKFEDSLKKFTKSKYVIATNTGTSALHIALKLVGVRKDTNVIVPTLSFVATGNAVIYNDAIPIFMDSSENSFCLDEKKLEKYLILNTYFLKGKRYSKHNKKIISAIIVTHVFGSTSDMKKIIKIGKKYSIPVVEDCAEGLGSFYKKKHLGTFGDVGILSFNGNKIITSGSGGAIITNSKKKYFGDKNFNLVNLDNNINFKSNYWLNALYIKNPKISKEVILNHLNNKGLQCRPIWDLLHTLPYFKKFKAYDVKASKKLFDRVILLPSSANLINN